MSADDDKMDDDATPDPQALTKHDHKVVPKTLPRGTVNKPIKLVFSFADRDPEATMSPHEWRDEFLRTWGRSK